MSEDIKMWKGNKVGVACNLPNKCEFLKYNKCTLDPCVICLQESNRKEEMNEKKKEIKASRVPLELDARAFKLTPEEEGE